MDNFSSHQVAGIRKAIEAAGAKLVFLSPYSPDFSPIELGWSKIKEFLRTQAARSYPALDEAITSAIDAIAPQDIVSWFRHCGYCVPSNWEPLYPSSVTLRFFLLLIFSTKEVY